MSDSFLRPASLFMHSPVQLPYSIRPAFIDNIRRNFGYFDFLIGFSTNMVAHEKNTLYYNN